MSTRNEGPERIDYQETDDIAELHAAVEREKPEPSADVTPIPLWLSGSRACARWRRSGPESISASSTAA
jgi:hypothetical protein